MEFAGQIWPALRESRARAVRSDNVTEYTHALLPDSAPLHLLMGDFNLPLDHFV